MDEARLNAIVEAVVREVMAARAAGGQPPAALPPAPAAAAPNAPGGSLAALSLDLPDPAAPEQRYRPGVANPKDPDALRALMASTTARIGVGRAGPRYRTPALLLFQADHAITQDALYRDMDPKLLDDLGLFAVQTRVTGGKQEYLLRPDLGRQLNDEARRLVAERCVKAPNLQLVVGDGLSAAAVEANVREMFPVIKRRTSASSMMIGA